MKKFVSSSLTLVATTLMVTLSFGCGEGIEGETGSQSAQLNQGQCNAIVATATRSAQRCFRGQCGADECSDVQGAFLDFFINNPECAGFFDSGDVNGLPGNASVHPQTGATKHIGEVICNAVFQCGLCPFAQEDVCPESCGVPPLP